MHYLVSPKWKKSVRYETTYKHKSRKNVYATHEQYYRHESFIVEFHKDANIDEIRTEGNLSLDDTDIVVGYEPHDGDGDETSSFWSFSGLTEEEESELEEYIEEEYGLEDHEDWEEIDVEIYVEGDLNIEPYS